MPSDSLRSQLQKIVSNDLPLQFPDRLAFIVGANPSMGARSPKLWNAAFRTFGIKGEMLPLDVRGEDLSELHVVLERDSRIVGVAVAAPYKEKMALLQADRLSDPARRCGSVNLLTRDADGTFCGINTDGIAAVQSLVEHTGDLTSEKVLFLGCGGTGRAILATLVDRLSPGQLTVAVRSDSQRNWLNSLGVQVSHWLSEVDLSSFDIVINSTTIGWGDQAGLSPLSVEQVWLLRGDCLVFDVVYQPDPSILLQVASQRSLATLSGSKMNLLQASIAFSTANHITDVVAVTDAMRAAVVDSTT